MESHLLRRLGILVITALLVGSVLAADCRSADSLRLSIRFMDDPPYRHSWLPWVDDHLRFELSIRNVSQDTVAVAKTMPCYDCNPKFFVRDAIDGDEPPRLREFDVTYPLTDFCYVDLAPQESFIDTIDVAEWITYDFSKGHRYRFWIENRPFEGYRFKDTLRKTPIWEKSLFSDTLEFTVE